jgi:hypothetical protein
MSDPTDPPEDPVLREFQNSPAQKIAREMANSPGAKLAREMADSPAAKLAQQYAESPMAKLTRQVADSPAIALARQLADSPTDKFLRDMGESPTANLAREVGLISNRELSGITAAAKAFAGITIDPSVAKALAGLKPLQIDPSVANAFAQIKSIAIAPEFAKAISEVHKALSDFGNAFAGIANAVKAIEEQNRFFQKSLVASLGGMIGDVARMSQWASTLGRMELADISSLYPTLPNAAAEVARLHGSMASLPGFVSMDQKHMSAMLGLDHELAPVSRPPGLRCPRSQASPTCSARKRRPGTKRIARCSGNGARAPIYPRISGATLGSGGGCTKPPKLTRAWPERTSSSRSRSSWRAVLPVVCDPTPARSQ